MISETVILGVILCLFILSYHSYSGPRWGKGPKTAYCRLVKVLGKPHYINTNPKGVSIWKKFTPDTPFTRVMLIDESVAQFIPYKHYGYLYVTINYEIDEKNIGDVLSCSESVMYDKLKKELTVRSNSLENSMVWLVLVHHINKGEIDVSQIREEIGKRTKLSYCNSQNNYNILQSIKDEYLLRNCDY
jgi:hypothetical protein